jgi:hypothetical protein
MDDILGQGGDREPSPWPRRLAAIAALIGVVVAGVVYLSRPHHQQTPGASTPATGTASPVPVGSVPVGSAVTDRPSEPNGIAGRTLPWVSSLRLPVAEAQPVWFSPASSRSAPIGGLPAVSSGYQFIRIIGGWVVLANPAATVDCNSCARPPVPIWYLADGARSVTRVGTANAVAPAATAGAVWLTSYQDGANVTTAAATAREVRVTGAPMGVPVRLPSGYLIDQATDRGLLLAPVSPPPGTPVYKLWDPAAPRASRTFAAVIAASPTEIAWTSRCAPTCQIQVLDLATGRRTAVELPPGNSAASGAFSPGGGFLALQVSFASDGDEGALAVQLEVASVASGRLTVMPGTWVSSDALVGYGWPASGDSLVAEFLFETKAQLAAWHPGAARPAVTVIRPGHALDSLILG